MKREELAKIVGNSQTAGRQSESVNEPLKLFE
jgi:hypothetical protein